MPKSPEDPVSGLSSWPSPWPIDVLIAKLGEDDTLERLVGVRRSGQGFDVRENLLEEMAAEVMLEAVGDSGRVQVRRQVRTSLGLADKRFPAMAQPDLAFIDPPLVHLCELKSNRVDYGRFDDVFDSKPFQAFLASHGDAGVRPYEVEQDLIKLSLYPTLAPTKVGSCLFLMVDACTRRPSWADILSSKSALSKRARTQWVRERVDSIAGAARIEPVQVAGLCARLVVIEMNPSWIP